MNRCAFNLDQTEAEAEEHGPSENRFDHYAQSLGMQQGCTPCDTSTLQQRTRVDEV